MKVTPQEVVHRLTACLSKITEALHRGIDYANDLQPDLSGRDAWFWSHSARFAARHALASAADTSANWELVTGVPNSGIHLRVDGLHVVRVLRSVAGTTPAPGHNRRRREAWQQFRQLQFAFDAHSGALPPMELILDWTSDDANGLIMHLGMPLGVWEHGNSPILAWRVELPSADGLENLIFTGTDDADVPVRLRVDDAEMEAL